MNRYPRVLAIAGLWYIVATLPAYQSFWYGGLLFAESKESAEQTVSQFSLAGYGQEGQKSWELVGSSADLFGHIIQLTNIVAHMYGKEETVIRAEKGEFDKDKNKVHLNQNVVAQTSEGARLLTQSLDWNHSTQSVSTEDEVVLQREGLKAKAKGATGQMGLKKLELKKEVEINLFNVRKDESSPITITCDGPLEIDYDKQEAVFFNNVKVTDKEIWIFSDKMTVYFDMKNKTVEKIDSQGNVKIVRDKNISFSDEAIYLARERKIVLQGRPRLVIYPDEGWQKGAVATTANEGGK